MDLKGKVDELIDAVDLSIKRRGLEIYMQDAFADYTMSEDLFDFDISVLSSSGTKFYDVELKYNEEYNKILASCTCPYSESNIGNCKHIIAAAFQWKKLLQKSVSTLSRTTTQKRIPTATIGYNKNEFIYPLRSLEYWELKFFQVGYPLPVVQATGQIRIDPIEKSCTLHFDRNITTSARYVSNGKIGVSCDCSLLLAERLCMHASSLLTAIARQYGVYYFKTYNDYRAEIEESLKSYGVKPGTELAKEFGFGLDGAGEFKMIKSPPNLLPLSSYAFWEDKLAAIPVLKTNNDAMAAKALPANITSVGLVIMLGGKNGCPIWIDGVMKIETKNKISLKKILLHKKEDLQAYRHLPEQVLAEIRKLTSENLIDYLAVKTGDFRYKSYSGRFTNLDPLAITTILVRLQEVLKQLVLINHPDLCFYTVAPYDTFSVLDCKPAQIQFSSEALQFQVVLKDEFWSLTCLLNGQNLESFTDYLPLFLTQEQNLYLLNDTEGEIIHLFKNGAIMVHQQDTEAFFEKIVNPILKKYPLHFEEGVEMQTQEIPGKPGIYLSELNESFLMIRPKWKYGEFETEMNGEKETFFTVREKVIRVIRDTAAEAEFIEILKGFHPRFPSQDNKEYFYLPFKEALEKSWFINFFSDLQRLDVPVYGISELKKFKYNSNSPSVKTNISSGIDWFDLSIEVHYGDQVIGLAELKKAVLAKQEYVLLKDGTFGILPEEWIKQYSDLFKMGRVKDDLLKVAKFHYTLLEQLHGKLDDEQILKEIADKRQRLQRIGHFNEVELPTNITATLRDYQLSGFQWLNQLDEIGWGGCLADDMGLGKTLQTLAFLQRRIQQHPEETHLIVCPTSLLYNWEAEIQKFTPSLKYHIYYGSDRTLLNEEDFKSNHLIISSYGMVRSDIGHFSKLQFGYVILDESQNIKNPSAQITKAVQLLKAKNRLILSGTPIQNNTFDLYAQMNFLNPGMLGSMEFFRTEFANAIDKNNDREKSEMLKKIVGPFMLRRTKEQVAQDLPDKTETVLWCDMGDVQRKVYDAYKKQYRENLMGRIEEDGMGKSSIYILEGLLKLRQICDSTDLLKDQQHPSDSVKIRELIRELTENTGTHKALIFSQFVEMLQLIRMELDKLGIPYSYLDGSTPAHKRKEAVDLFQEDDDRRVFLISLKAGGVGLNLTSADYVYLVDPWWNPAAEQQAIDRTHRIGQKNKIFAYKMICKDSVEEKIILLQQKKKALAGELIADDAGFVKKLSKDDVAFLFS